MAGLIFLGLAFLTAFFSIKLSAYADALNRQTKVGSLLIGGLILAAITSFPELITALAAIYINNIGLAIGDILGSNAFNLLIISVLNIVFVKHFFMKKISPKYGYLIGLIIIVYFLLLYIVNGSLATHEILSLMSLVILLIYVVFVVFLSKIKIKEPSVKGNEVKNVIYKFIFTGMILIIISVGLTMQADKIFRLNTMFSSSTIGAFLLGITTSLPEVATTYALIAIGSYNLGFANIIGSNAFNFCILVICDLFVRGGHLYHFWDGDALLFLKFGLLMHFVLLFSILFKSSSNRIIYLSTSLILSLIYFVMFYLQFH